MRFGQQPVTLTGVLIYDPEMRFTPSGRSHCTLHLNADELGMTVHAVGWQETGEKLAELSEGDIIRVTGNWKTRTFTAEQGEQTVEEFVIRSFETEAPF